MKKKSLFNLDFLKNLGKKPSQDENEVSDEEWDADQEDQETLETQVNQENQETQDNDDNLDNEDLGKEYQTSLTSKDKLKYQKEIDKIERLDQDDQTTTTSTTHFENEEVNLEDLVKKHRDKLLNEEPSLETEEERDARELQEARKEFSELKTDHINDILEEAKSKKNFQFFSFKSKFGAFGTQSDEKGKGSLARGLNGIDGIDGIDDQSSNGQNIILRIKKFEWNSFILRLFSPYNRYRIHALYLVLLVGVMTYLGGKSTALFFSLIKIPKGKITNIETPPLQENHNVTLNDDVNKIININLFNVKESEKEIPKAPKIDIDSIICHKGEKPTQFPLKLMDTVVLQDSVKSVASVQVRGSMELFNLREGEKVDNMVEISRINRLNVVVKNLENGDCELLGNNEDEGLELPPDLKIFPASARKNLFKSTNPEIKNDGNKFKITKGFRNKMLTNINQLLTEARAIPINNPDGTMSYKMVEIVPGSLYTQLNIQENDIIHQINGKKIENHNELMSMLGRIKEIDQFQISVKRNGVNENLDFNFE